MFFFHRSLDNRYPSLFLSSPTYIKVVPGEGMPVAPIIPTTKAAPSTAPPQPQGKGDLILAFDIVFPETLTEEQKQLLDEANL